MIKNGFLLFGVLFFSGAALAQEAPPPRKMPRVPVSREFLPSGREPMPASREKHGIAAVIDGEKLRIGETNLRLFGIVPPQLSASFGPQARGELDTLAGGQNVACQIRDRDRDGWLLATCQNNAGNDLALELLKRGLAVAARGSIADTELAVTYLGAEQAAQAQKLGLWSASSYASVSATPVAPKEGVEAKKEEQTAAKADAQTQAKIAADVLSEQARLDEMGGEPGEARGFFERFQILLAGILAVLTALGILGVLAVQRNRERCEELRGLAAALRGELTAMRNICAGRAKSIASEVDDRVAAWPRLRATLYQAYVGTLGCLGADLARQIATIYGQSSDFAAYYNPASGMPDAPKKQALEALVKHIDEILPRLAVIEKTGKIPTTGYISAVRRVSAEAKSNIAAYRPPMRIAAPAPAPAAPTLVAPVPTAAAAPAAPIEPPAAAVAPSPPPAARTTPPVPTPLSRVAARVSSLPLRERATSFLRSCREAMARPPAPPPSPIDPQSAEYTALIEAEMMRYQYEEQIRSIETLQQKRRG